MRDRAADIAYRNRQASKGLRQLSIWVPGELQVLLVELGAIARSLPPASDPADMPSLSSLTRDIEHLVQDYRRSEPR
jgi:hypothetical protein